MRQGISLLYPLDWMWKDKLFSFYYLNLERVWVVYSPSKLQTPQPGFDSILWRMKLLVFLFLITLFISCTTSASTNKHPLDPLTPSEFKLVRSTVQKTYKASSPTLTFQYIGLDEPDKALVLSWESSKTNKTKAATLPPRRALVIARFKKQSLEITVDLSKASIVSTKVYTGHGFPMITFDEQDFVAALPFKYKPFMESVQKRGLNISDVVCSTASVGWYGEIKSKRRLKLQCFYMKGSSNLFARPLEGITVIADLDERKIVEYFDNFDIPVPKAEDTEYVAKKQKPPFGPTLMGAAFVQPNGPGFKIDGHSIRLYSSYHPFFSTVTWFEGFYLHGFLKGY